MSIRAMGSFFSKKMAAYIYRYNSELGVDVFYNNNYMSNKIRNIAKRKANPITSKEEKLLNEFIKFNEVKGKEILKKLKLIYKIK